MLHPGDLSPSLKRRVLVVVGARPNFMKAAPLIEALERTGRFEITLIHTGQHFDRNMSKIFFDEFKLPEPDVNLGVSEPNHGAQVARVMEALEGEAKTRKPDFIVVVGDVNSTLAASLVANNLGIKLAHVEAGLRSFDRTMPEEVNRVLVDQLADYLFTPSPDADQNLKQEGVACEKIYRVGNIMVDTLLRFRESASQLKAWKRFGLTPKQYGIVTLHRPSNVDDPDTLKDIVEALLEIEKSLALVFPVHPRTKAKLEAGDFLEKLEGAANVTITKPLGYLENLSLMTDARLAITDSGGIQEETTVLGVPCLTVRANTERPVTISEGTNRLVPQSKTGILSGFKKLLAGNHAKAHQPELWDGKTSERIVDVLSK